MSRINQATMAHPMTHLHGPSMLRQVAAAIARWYETWRQRSDLAQLTRRELFDIGLTEIEVLRECRKPFWRS